MEHAFLSCSGAIKWLNCPKSPFLEKEFQNNDTVYSKKGNILHDIAELTLKCILLTENEEYFKNLKDLCCTSEDKKIVREYVNYCIDILGNSDIFGIEKKVDLGFIIPKGFGTVDFYCVKNNVLHVIDFKSGSGVLVNPKENIQLSLYALGLKNLYEVEKIQLHIVQPTLQNVNNWEVTEEFINKLEKDIFKSVKYLESNDLFCNAGIWCNKGFCKARQSCSTYKDYVYKKELFKKNAFDLLTNNELNNLYLETRHVKKWLESLEDEIKNRLQSGKPFKNLSLTVQKGRQSFKKEGSEVLLNNLLTAGADISELTSLKTPLQIKKYLQKINIEFDFDGYIIEGESINKIKVLENG